MSEVEGISLG
jgi:hypothetical protein